jgi:hypothetical protein
MFSFLFSLALVLILSIISHFYIQESIQTLEESEKHKVECFANKILSKKQSYKDFRKMLYGSLESFTYKIAILDDNNTVIYSTFKQTPTYNPNKMSYYKDGSIFYNNIIFFEDRGISKIILQDKIDYSGIKTKGFIIIFLCFLFLIGCSFFLYFHIKDLYTSINERLDLFFKDAMHEIRTPLGVLQINLDFLENNLENSMPLKRAQGGLRNLTSVYESLEYSIKNQKVKYKKEELCLSTFLKTRIDFFNVLAEIKMIKIISSIQEDIFVVFSREELQRLIDNNISNAIKYSKEETQVSICVFVNEEEDITLEFINQGDPIPEPQKIFQRYYRGDQIRGGFGIGLNIVEYICNLYRIKYCVTSMQGHNVFLYTIPKNIRIKDER